MSLTDIISRTAPVRTRKTSFCSLLGLRRSRRALAALDERALRDVGLSADAAKAEADRSVWDVPETWKNR